MPNSNAKESIQNLSREAFLKKIHRIETLVNDLNQELEGFIALPDEDRKYSEGRFRENESEVLRQMLAIADIRPQLFAPLADKDEGLDPHHFETKLLRDRLERRDAVADVAERLEPSLRKLRDTALYLGELTKPVLLAAYRLIKPVAEHDTELRTKLAPVINFYASAQLRRKTKNEPSR